jgi:microcystin-dependent protein
MATALRYPKGHQFRDGSDLAVAAGKLNYYRAGTSTALETYSDKDGLNANALTSGSIILDGAGRLQEAIYLGDVHDAKEVLATSGGVTVSPWPDDFIPRAQTLAPIDVGYAPPLTACLSLNQSNSPYTLAAADAGKTILASTSGGSLTVNLPPAASMTNGQGYWFLKETAANILTIAANGADLIGGFSQYKASIARQSFALVSNGAKWSALFDSDGGPGNLKWWPTSTCPEGRFECDGTAKSRTTYAELYAAIGTLYGAGDGSTTFNLPDLRGEFLRGYDNGRGVDAARVFASAQAGAVEDHTHFIASDEPSSTAADNISSIAKTKATTQSSDYNLCKGTVEATLGLTSGSSGSVAAETRPRNIAMLPTIKF